MREFRSSSTILGGAFISAGGIVLAGAIVLAARARGLGLTVDAAILVAAALICSGGMFFVLVGTGYVRPPRRTRQRLEALEQSREEREAQARQDAHDTSVALKELVEMLRKQAQASATAPRPAARQSPRRTKRDLSPQPPSRESVGKD